MNNTTGLLHNLSLHINIYILSHFPLKTVILIDKPLENNPIRYIFNTLFLFSNYNEKNEKTPFKEYFNVYYNTTLMKLPFVIFKTYIAKNRDVNLLTMLFIECVKTIFFIFISP